MPPDMPEHPAVTAWRELQPARLEPHKIDMLKKAKTTTVYRLAGVGPQGSAIVAKRCGQEKALLERTIYEEVLPHLPIRTLRYYGCVMDLEDDFGWLFLEDAGQGRYSSYIEEHRLLAAHWLGLLHLTAARLPLQKRLPERGPEYYLEELRSTRDTIRQNRDNPVLTADDVVVLNAIVSQYDLLESRWRQVEALCNRMPQTLVHGHVEKRNIRLRTTAWGTVLFLFDWETASWGTPAIDFAQVILDSVSSPVKTYLSIVRSCWPHLNARDLKQLASIGALFQMILSIGGAHYGIVYDLWASQGLAYDYTKWTMHELRSYRTRLDDAGRAIQWEDENR
jgi:thiamine kinase-like enzyme